jgi:hypothetical protein
MNSVVYVLVIFIYTGYAPTVEFKTKEKCEAAIKAIAYDVNPSPPAWDNIPMKNAKCVRIEK